MKKVLLAGTALLGLAVISAPAHADIDLDLGGYFAGYGVFTDNDETGTGAAGDELRSFEFRRDNEFFITGETTTDHGLTVGAYTEAQVGNSTANVGPVTSIIDETYLYMSGGWGRVNFGTEDGAAYLLQVAAPSADSNVDGLRTYISALNSDVWFDAALDGDAAPAGANAAFLDYQHADFRQTDRLSYLTPKFNGFQAGVSYAPEPIFYGPNDGAAPAVTDDVMGAYEDLWEAGVRWDGEFQGFGISLGGGYSHASTEIDLAAGDAAVGSDDIETWNTGLNVTFAGFSLGGSYHTTNNGIETTGAAGITEEDTETWVIGAAWDNGPYHLGATYLDREYGNATFANAAVPGGVSELEVNRATVGGGYTFGPGMTFRGAVAFGNADANTAGVSDSDFTQVTVGTDIQF